MGGLTPFFYSYDDLSRLLTATNGVGTVTRTYNNRGRLATEEDVFGHDLAFTYDPVGNRTELELDSAALTSYAYDNANRLTTLTDESSNDFTFAYDNANKLTSRVAPNGITSSYEYDGMSRIKRLKHYTSSSTLYDDQFAYNAASQISQITGLSQTKNFTYDNVNRLTAVTVGTSTVENYAYDGVGNRTSSHLSSTYTTGSFNRLTATDTASYTYNSNGSMTGKTVGSTGWAYAWNRENAMASAGNGTDTVTYLYDALGRRVKRTQGSDVQKFTNDGGDVVLDDINSTLTKYQNGPGVDDKLKLVTGGTSKYFFPDHLGSTVGIATLSGSVTDSNGYAAFGNASNGSFPSRYQFTGREADPLTGLQFNRARSYDIDLGRFVSEDPIGLGGGINEYAYVRNNPVNATDPTGLYERDVHFYLTYYLALQNGCFTRRAAFEIAAGNQRVDDDPATAPGYGQTYINSHYHALNEEARPGVGSPSLLANVPYGGTWHFGKYLHYLQDTFSHDGYPDSTWGHAKGFHTVDKTATDVEKAMRMAKDTYGALDGYGQLMCKCKAKPWDSEMEGTVRAFSEVTTENPRIADIDGATGIPGLPRRSFDLADPEAMQKKASILHF